MMLEIDDGTWENDEHARQMNIQELRDNNKNNSFVFRSIFIAMDHICIYQKN